MNIYYLFYLTPILTFVLFFFVAKYSRLITDMLQMIHNCQTTFNNTPTTTSPRSTFSQLASLYGILCGPIHNYGNRGTDVKILNAKQSSLNRSGLLRGSHEEELIGVITNDTPFDRSGLLPVID
jgi:hypothetical protein